MNIKDILDLDPTLQTVARGLVKLAPKQYHKPFEVHFGPKLYCPAETVMLLKEIQGLESTVNALAGHRVVDHKANATKEEVVTEFFEAFGRFFLQVAEDRKVAEAKDNQVIDSIDQALREMGEEA